MLSLCIFFKQTTTDDVRIRDCSSDVFSSDLDDFIAAAEYLKAQGITGEDQLAIEGRSNGGLLVGAVTNQRRDLFAAALPIVGVMDMLRFDRFTAGRSCVDDYGYPSRATDFLNLLRYSPYQNLQDGLEYTALVLGIGRPPCRKRVGT